MKVRSPSRRLSLAAGIIALAGFAANGAALARDEPQPGSPSAEDRVARLNDLLKPGWTENGVTPSARATDAEFLRRAFLDLVGRIPTVQEAASFLENKDRGKRAKLIDYLLEHPDYARNFSNVWTVSLIGRGNQGNEVNRGALRAWLRVQFGTNRPWNEVAYDLVAASGPNTEENGATNFVIAHREFDAVPLTSITTRVFLGQQIQCTQCHDHPSNDWKQADFWGINAFFRGVDVQRVDRTDASGAEVADHFELGDEPTEAYAKYDRRDGTVRIAFPTYLDGTKVGQGSDVKRRQELGKLITSPDNEQFAKAFANRMWGHLMGRGVVHPVDDFGAHNPPSNPELMDELGQQFHDSGYDVKDLLRTLMSTEAYHLSSTMNRTNEKDETLFSHMAMKPMTPEQLFESLLVATSAHKSGRAGDSDQRRDRWLRQFIFNFATDETQEGSSFQGTIPQALMMMNGDLMEEATSGKPGSFLASVLEQARMQRGSAEPYVVQQLYLAALSRPPTKKEMNAAGAFLGNNPDPIGVMQDLFWALLNSNEFVLVH